MKAQSNVLGYGIMLAIIVGFALAICVGCRVKVDNEDHYAKTPALAPIQSNNRRTPIEMVQVAEAACKGIVSYTMSIYYNKSDGGVASVSNFTCQQTPKLEGQ